MGRNEVTSKRIAAIAAKGIKSPLKLTLEEVQMICASVLTQAPDKKAAPRKKKAAPRKKRS
jgi:hypothetical protein